MNNTRLLLAGACAISLVSMCSASADPLTDFSTIAGSNNSALGASTSLDGVNVSAYEGGFTTTSNLWLRKEGSNDNGLGVCSSGETCPTGGSGGGDVNELSNESQIEWIVLQRPSDKSWSEIWVSSLDNNGNGPAETGSVFWGNTLGDLTNGFSFQYGDFGSGVYNGNILSLPISSGFDNFANFVMFRAGFIDAPAGADQNNDYLVWGVTLADCPDCRTQNVPEPVTLSLVGAGLLGAAVLRRRRKKSD